MLIQYSHALTRPSSSLSSPSSLPSPQSAQDERLSERGRGPHVELGGLQGPGASLVLAGPGQDREGGEDCGGGGGEAGGTIREGAWGDG